MRTTRGLASGLVLMTCGLGLVLGLGLVGLGCNPQSCGLQKDSHFSFGS